MIMYAGVGTFAKVSMPTYFGASWRGSRSPNSQDAGVHVNGTHPEAARICVAGKLLAYVLLCLQLLVDLAAKRLLVAQDAVVLLVLPEGVLHPSLICLQGPHQVSDQQYQQKFSKT